MGSCFESSTTQTIGGVQAVRTESAMNRELDDAVNLTKAQFMNSDDLSNGLELHFSCTNLPNMDTFSKSDPFVIVYLKDKASGRWIEKGRTEVIEDNLNPTFVKCVKIDYKFEERQPLKLEIYDADDRSNLRDLSKQDYIGKRELFVHEIVRAPKQPLDLGIENPKMKKNGSLKVWGDQISERGTANLISMLIEGSNMRSGYKLMLKISRCKQIDGDEFVPVFQSELAKFHGGAYRWNKFHIKASDLIRDDPNRMIQIHLYNWKANGSHVLLAKQEFLFQNLLTQKLDWPIPKIGNIVFRLVDLEVRHSFLDYILGGCGVSLMVAVDFTMSNRPPNDPNSLHYYDMNTNQYLKAIQAVGSILEAYDSDKMIPALGFGGNLTHLYGKTSHCFALNGNIFNPELFGVQGVLEAYKSSITKVKLSGPTNFGQIIKYAADMAESYLAHNLTQNYFILLILTDGLIMDLEQTIDEIVRGTSLPLSIVIVGVGDEDFSEMDKLDADEVPLYSRRFQKQMERDIVQFVPFNEFKNNSDALARETLREIPTQLVEHMTKRKINPQPRLEAMATMPLQQMGTLHPAAAVPAPEYDYFGEKMVLFRDRLAQRGVTDFGLVDSIIQKGFPIEDVDIFLKCMNPQYINHLASAPTQVPYYH